MRILVPDPDLRALLRAGFVRDTRGLQLAPGQSRNHFAAVPYCCFSFVRSGQAYLVEADGRRGPPLPRDFVSGPQLRAFASQHSAPLDSLAFVFHADAFARFTGLAPAALVNQHLPMACLDTAAHPLDWRALSAAVHAAPDAAAAWQAGQAWLRSAMPPTPDATDAGAMQAWRAPPPQAKVHATARALGVSERSFNRLTQRRTGLRAHTLTRLHRAQHALVDLMDGREPLAAVASRHGYADQAHLTRECKELVGFTPRQLRAMAQQPDERWWALRLRE